MQLSYVNSRPIPSLPGTISHIIVTTRHGAQSTHSTDGLLMSQPFSFIADVDPTRRNYKKRKWHDSHRLYFHSFSCNEETNHNDHHSQRRNFYNQLCHKDGTSTSLGMVRRRRYQHHNNNQNDDDENEYSMESSFRTPYSHLPKTAPYFINWFS